MKVWTAEQANRWYEATAWQIGMNYLPSTAVNSTEMWQKESFDEETIRCELAWAADCGYNSVRVFLQFLVWEAERDGFLDTFEKQNVIFNDVKKNGDVYESESSAVFCDVLFGVIGCSRAV